MLIHKFSQNYVQRTSYSLNVIFAQNFWYYCAYKISFSLFQGVRGVHDGQTHGGERGGVKGGGLNEFSFWFPLTLLREVLECSSNSPDLNPIEVLWAFSKQQLQKQCQKCVKIVLEQRRKSVKKMTQLWIQTYVKTVQIPYKMLKKLKSYWPDTRELIWSQNVVLFDVCGSI